MGKKILICFFLLSLIATPVQAQLRLQAGFLDYQEESIKVSQGVTVSKEETVVNAPRGEYWREEKKALLQGGVIMEANTGTIEGKEMTAWFAEDRYLFRQQVVMNYRKENEEADQTFILKSAMLELFAKTDSFQAKEGVVIDYQERLLKSEQADYNGETEELVLTKNVLIEEENGDWIKSERAVFDLASEEEHFTAEGPVEIEITLNDEE